MVVICGYKRKNYINSVLSSGGDEAQKCKTLMSTHVSRCKGLPNYAANKKGWTIIFNSFLRAAENNNINLDKPQKWRNYVI